MAKDKVDELAEMFAILRTANVPSKYTKKEWRVYLICLATALREAIDERINPLCKIVSGNTVALSELQQRVEKLENKPVDIHSALLKKEAEVRARLESEAPDDR